MEHETLYQDYPVCPHCGHIHEEEMDFLDGDIESVREFDCDECGKPYLLYARIDRTWNALKPPNTPAANGG